MSQYKDIHDSDGCNNNIILDPIGLREEIAKFFKQEKIYQIGKQGDPIELLIFFLQSFHSISFPDYNKNLKENAKLQGRLQKAVEVFKEQKADITRLTDERDRAKSEVEKLNARVAELEKQTAEKNEQDSQFFEQVQEIETLKEKVAETEKNLDDTKTVLTDTQTIPILLSST